MRTAIVAVMTHHPVTHGHRLATHCRTAAVDGVPDGRQQYVVAKRLREEFGGPRLHCLNRHRHVAVTRDENDRHVSALNSDALLQIEAVEARHAHIEHQAARRNGPWTGEEFLRRREYLRLPAGAAN